MINKLDIEEITRSVVDVLRVRTSWYRVTLSSADMEATENFVRELLSKYEDNSNIQDQQYNPHANRTETIDTDEANSSL